VSSTLASLLREAVMRFAALAAPVLGAVIAVGLVSAIAQSASGLRERSLSSVPKVIAAMAVLVIAGPWIATRWIAFLQSVLAAVPTVGRG